MPYEIQQSAKGYCVHKQGGGLVPGGCHKSKSKALRHMRALYANEPETMKAEGKGYGARAGETIQGNLVRGSDGKFASAGAGSNESTAEEKPRVRRQKLGRTEAARAAAKLQAREDKKRATAGASEAKRQARRAETERRRAAIKKQQADAKARQLAANRKAVIDATQLDDASLSALEAFARGGNLEAGDTTDALIALGLVTKSPTTGEYVMTGPGKSLLSAVKSGDIRQAKDAENAGREARARVRQQRSKREKSAETLKHGKHNQATHANRYGRGFGATKRQFARLDKADREKFKAEARRRRDTENAAAAAPSRPRFDHPIDGDVAFKPMGSYNGRRSHEARKGAGYPWASVKIEETHRGSNLYNAYNEHYVGGQGQTERTYYSRQAPLRQAKADAKSILDQTIGIHSGGKLVFGEGSP